MEQGISLSVGVKELMLGCLLFHGINILKAFSFYQSLDIPRTCLGFKGSG